MNFTMDFLNETRDWVIPMQWIKSSIDKLKVSEIKEWFQINGLNLPDVKNPKKKDYLASLDTYRNPGNDETKKEIASLIQEANNNILAIREEKINSFVIAFSEKQNLKSLRIGFGSFVYIRKQHKRLKSWISRVFIDYTQPEFERLGYLTECLKFYKELHYILDIAQFHYEHPYHDQYKEDHSQTLLVESFKQHACNPKTSNDFTRLFSNPQKETQQLVWLPLIKGQAPKPANLSNKQAADAGYYQLTHKRTDVVVHRWLLELKATDHPLKPKEESQIKNYLQLQDDYDIGLLINFRTNLQTEFIEWKIFYHKC